MIRKRAVYLYLFLTFSLAWLIFALVAVMNRSAADPLSILMITAAAMFSPAISAIIVKRLYLREGFGSYGFNFKKIEYHLIAWLLPVILSLFALLLTLASGLGKLDPTMGSFFRMLSKESIKTLGDTVPSFWAILTISMFLPVIINFFFTFGEELGWRGFLQDELKPLGQKWSYSLIGLIWGIWHAPIILQGHNYPSNPYLGMLWMIIFCVLLSNIFCWLKDRSGSVFAPTIAHASLNGPAMVTYMVLKDYNFFLGGILGLAGFVAMGSFVAYLLITKQIN